MPIPKEYKEISASLSDFVEEMSLAIAQSKKNLDESSLNTLKELAKTNIEIPILKQEVTQNGVSDKISYVKVSALSLGMKPTFYEFSETKIEVSMDLSVAEEVTSTTNTKKKKLFVNTKDIKNERRFESNLNAFSKLSITMVPVPAPNNIPEIIQEYENK